MQASYLINGKELTFIKPHVMGIVNLTPDSFYDGGKFSTVKDVLIDVEKKVTAGATIIDIGAASSKPGAVIISDTEEIERLKPILSEVKNKFPETFISVDTYHATVANYALNQGVDIINDISGGHLDTQMIDVVAKHDAVYVMMHMQGTPQNMQNNPSYKDVTTDIFDFFKNKIEVCVSKNVTKLIIDPGFGFGKTLEHNYQLLKSLNYFKTLNYPILAGLSRKSMISKVLNSNADAALTGTICLNTIALLNGASVIRVHDVAEAKQVTELMSFYSSC